MRDRAVRRAKTRITSEQVRKARWTEQEIQSITDRVWDVSRITNHLDALHRRGLAYFYNVGTNDSVTPGLLEMGRRFPDFPICIIPGGQHGGPSDAGYTRRVPLLPEVKNNFVSFARHHFHNARDMPAAPNISGDWTGANTISISVAFPDGTEPEQNDIWWTLNRSRPYTLPFEYDHWESTKLERVGHGEYRAKVTFHGSPDRFDFVSLHTHTENDLPITMSSSYQRLAPTNKRFDN